MDMHAELLRLGETFRQVREQQRLSAQELAAKTGITGQQISDLETGRLDPTLDVLIALASGMGVRVSALMPKD
jgi:transcriptional regulator with XRE-family HTH domain